MNQRNRRGGGSGSGGGGGRTGGAPNHQDKERFRMCAQETLTIIESGNYIVEKSRDEVVISEEIRNSIEKSVLYTPSDFTDDFLHSGIREAKKEKETIFQFSYELTLEAAERLITQQKDLVALNFASARNPGGGFLTGAKAQEESIARSSALYPTINKHQTMYKDNQNERSGTYLHYMIYSPLVPVFRNDSCELINPYLLSIITAPAVNAGVVRDRLKNGAEEVIDTHMQQRIDRILSVALHHRHTSLLLGAFGCGVFKNNPAAVANIFQKLLLGKYRNCFSYVHFAIPDNKFLAIFRLKFQ